MLPAMVTVVIAVALLAAGIWFSGWAQGYKDANGRASKLVCKSPGIDLGTKTSLSAQILSGPDTKEGE